MCIVKPDGPPQLCKTDEIGEIIINSRAGGNMYYGLPGLTKNTFEVRKQKYNTNPLALIQSRKIRKSQNFHFFCFCFFVLPSFLSVGCCVQVIPVNANGVPIGEIPFVRSGLLGFVGPVSETVSFEYICGNLSLLETLLLSLPLNGSVY